MKVPVVKKFNPKISIITPYRNLVEGYKEALEAQTYKNYELILLTEKDLGLKGRKGAGYMRNEGAKKARGDILLFLDEDAILLPDTLETIVTLFKENKVSAVSGLPIAPPRGKISLLNWLLGLEYEKRIREMGTGLVDVSASTCLAIKKDVFKKMGGFITQFIGGIGEDWDLTMRMSKAGYKIWHSNNVRFYHYIATSLNWYLKKQFYHAWYRVEFRRKFNKTFDEYAKRYSLLSSVLFFNIPMAINLFRWKRRAEVFLLIPLSIIRSFVWILAGMKGMWDFLIKPKVIK